jgi:hypothetical protein
LRNLSISARSALDHERDVQGPTGAVKIFCSDCFTHESGSFLIVGLGAVSKRGDGGVGGRGSTGLVRVTEKLGGISPLGLAWLAPEPEPYCPDDDSLMKSTAACSNSDMATARPSDFRASALRDSMLRIL